MAGSNNTSRGDDHEETVQQGGQNMLFPIMQSLLYKKAYIIRGMALHEICGGYYPEHEEWAWSVVTLGRARPTTSRSKLSRRIYIPEP